MHNFCPGVFNPCAVLCEPNTTSGAFDLEISPYSGEFDQAFFKMSNALGLARGRGGGVIAFGIDPDISGTRAATVYETS